MVFSKHPGRTIVIAVDESPVSREAMNWAADNLIHKEDSIKLMTVVDPIERPTYANPGGLGTPPIEIPSERVADPGQLNRRNALLKEYGDSLKKKASTVGMTTVVSSALGDSTSDHGRHICEYAAEHKADILILGSRGHGSFKRSIMSIFGLGSVSNFVVNHATVPNVLIHKHMQ
jgi:nucleotide-binding universal stress UspA family protein